MTNAVTEEEARERACCGPPAIVGASLAAAALQAAGNGAEVTISGQDRLGKCCASECMAWRKVTGDFDKGGNLPGYCGLAGAIGAPVHD